MTRQTFVPRRGRRLFVSLLLLLTFSVAALANIPATARPATRQESAERQRALQLFSQGEYLEALPLLEKLAAANSSDAEVLFCLGFSILAKTQTIKEPAARQKERVRARVAFVRSKELGMQHSLLDAIIKAIPPDGNEDKEKLSQNEEANRAMNEAEAAFVKGETERAVAGYARALQLDPKLYEAPLFAGDAYLQNKQYGKAGEWYARAVAINPEQERGYRYWGDALLRAGKVDEARDKYIEAVIASPYDGNVWENGLIRWAQRAAVRLGHPNIKPPANVLAVKGKDKDISITLDPAMLNGDKADGSSAWMGYSMTRAIWMGEKFRKEYPKETAYRHSLREEADALGMVVTVVKEQTREKKIKTLDPMLARLVKLHDEGLLEPFILFALADEGIAHDFAEYRRTNRDKLRRYLTEYVTAGTN